MKTGIASLDEMLGGEGIPDGRTMLLRGGPGSGKTTLALQIAANHLAQKTTVSYVIFISLETEPEQAIDHMKKAFGIELYDPIHCRCFRSNDVQQAINGDIRRLSDYISTLIAEFWDEFGAKPNELDPPSGLIIIDSLNVLANIFLNPGQDTRGVVHEACAKLQSLRDRATVILISEYDPNNPRVESVAAESYFCDVDIQLVREPVVTKRATIPSEVTAGVGLSGDWKQPDPHKPETRLFCRVIKCRPCDCQSRRCAYDIVSGLGIHFYDTYPADGQIMLFTENNAQQQEWEYFFATDLFQQYPALQFGFFGRTGLQRTFSSLRHFQHIPLRTDLYLSSFDTYWINWYQEFCLRYDLEEIMSKKLKCGNKPGNKTSDLMRKNFARIVGVTQKKFAGWLPSMTPTENDLQELSQHICTRICNLSVPPCTQPCVNQIPEVLQAAWDIASKPERRGGLLHPLPKDAIKLFGEQERPTKIIHELEEDVKTSGKVPIFWPTLNGLKEPDENEGQKEYLAVPYNANVGMLVCRKDCLKIILEGLNREKLVKRIVELHQNKQKVIHNFLHNARKDNKPLNCNMPSEIDDLEVISKVANDRVDNLYNGGLPDTWEEIIALCSKKTNPDKATYHFLIETQTFDTQLCTLMELIWSVGGGLKVTPDYSIEAPDETALKLFEAFWIFHEMRRYDIIPRNSTLEVVDFAKKFGMNDKHKKDWAPSPDWLFARHWHSTFVDILTARNKETKEFIWKPPINKDKKEIELEIAPIPVTLSRYIKPPEDGKTHQSCWGEWYLACLKGSENTSLAIDLINNLMSSRKVCEPAFSCAALPTVETFYEPTMYGEVECFNIPERSDIKLPKIKFRELRNAIFKSARSRTEVFDYRHCMRPLHAVLEQVHDFPQNISPDALGDKLIKALEKIELLGET